ncbi:MAG: glycosyl hydrolase 53 family protein [Alistipes sp.]|nr:glycosyl hydrolase 53 family protein [Alistipes sp.]
MKNRLLLLVFACFVLAGCHSESGEEQLPEGPVQSASGFARGADISWVTQLEKEGYVFYNTSGQVRECTALMKELGMDAIRLRVWVNPENGWCGKDDVLKKARRAKALGMRLMIDFHYSDSWADPGKQTPPAAWAGANLMEMQNLVKTHTADVLRALKAENIAVEWVQVGNETSNGMLWPMGKCDTSPAAYAALHNTGYEAVKSVYPDAKVIVHLHNGDDANLYNWLLGELERKGAKYDMIGMSLYPPQNWRIKSELTIANMKSLYAKFGKRVMVCEVGMPWDNADGCYDFLKYMLAEAERGGCCDGLFYWEPEAPVGYSGGYTLGAFADGRPTRALDAFSASK